MKINKLNYENFVIDYIEGTLSIELKKDFDLFLEKNDEVYEEIKDYISAPVFEESNEIFTAKKTIKKSTKLSPYILLTIIPFLLGAYFLLPNKTESKKPILKEIPTEIINQFAQEKNIEVEQEIKSENKSSLKKEVKKLPIQKKPNKKTDSKEVKQSQAVLYADNSNSQGAIFEKIEPVYVVQVNESKVDSPVSIDAVAALEALPFNTFKTNNELDIMNGAMADLNPKERSLNSQLADKNSWLEMITPASFEDIDLKESLAIESNININTSRKILNAFIPESFVK